jgi:HSP20 family protein
MAMRDLIPWSRARDVSVRRGDDLNPFVSLQREMNRLFDDVFRGFEFAPMSSDRLFHRGGWPSLELSETDTDVKIVAELPGLDERDVQLELASGVLTIKGEKKTETEDNNRLFSERYYGRFERRIALDNVEEDRIAASFKNGVLTITLPKSREAQQQVKRIPINGK